MADGAGLVEGGADAVGLVEVHVPVLDEDVAPESG